MRKICLTAKDVSAAASSLTLQILLDTDNRSAINGRSATIGVYGVPRGGVPVALALAAHSGKLLVVDSPEQADIIVDDIVDSGKTRLNYLRNYPNKPFYALFDKKLMEADWVQFPWEQELDGDIATSITRLLQQIGEDPTREGLRETPARVAKAWTEYWASGYTQNIGDVFKTFEDGGEHYDQMIVVKDIPFYSLCEHHMAPIFGTASIAYIPRDHIVGLSKLSRLLDIFAHRLQVQERLTQQVAHTLFTELHPRGCGVHIKARHMCMESRGICKQGHHTITCALHGVFTEPDVKQEFLDHVR